MCCVAGVNCWFLETLPDALRSYFKAVRMQNFRKPSPRSGETMMEKMKLDRMSNRYSWAIALSFATTILLGLEAIHPVMCPIITMDANQYFAFTAGFATLTGFMAAFLLSRLIASTTLQPK